MQHITWPTCTDIAGFVALDGDTELVHVHHPVIVTYTTGVSLPYYVGYIHVRHIWSTGGYIHNPGCWHLLSGMLIWFNEVVPLLSIPHPGLVSSVWWDTDYITLLLLILPHPGLVSVMIWVIDMFDGVGQDVGFLFAVGKWSCYSHTHTQTPLHSNR